MNEFQSTYLLHQLLGEEQLLWLQQYAHLRLSDDEARALILAKETGAVDNAGLRAVTDLDTLAASEVLKRLYHQLKLLEQGGAGSATYYRLAGNLNEENLPLFATNKGNTGDLEAQTGDLEAQTGDLEAQTGDLEAQTGDLIPKELLEVINNLSVKPSKQVLWVVVLGLCAVAPMTSHYIASLLERSEKHLKSDHLTKMRKEGLINYLYPEVINHPEQAYVITEQGKQWLTENRIA